ncbi:putative glutamine amidotransferase [termite gut metagenome]|uniref:Putative glutamine amidotransferase n=1 Tax=termite gut metagenome TaxID=433724 RepID=A0A5J4RTJ0_9ZZZZ
MMKYYYLLPLLALLAFHSAVAQDSPKESLIGISCSHPEDYSSVRMTYTESVIKAGGIPILIPVTENEKTLEDIVSLLDGLILTGGEDIHPNYYNEDPIEQLGEVNSERDHYDMALIRLATVRNLPILGICRGEQLINVVFGGTLYQDLPTQYNGISVNHQQEEPSSVATHTVFVHSGSIIAEITGCTELQTNTHHHQAVKDVAPGFRVAARSGDGVVEAIESCTDLPIWGVQFHPEGLTVAGDTVMVKFFEFLTGRAETFRTSKKESNPKR